MTFQPVLPTGGIAGWRYLERTLDAQRGAFAAAGGPAGDLDHFRDAIGSVATAEALVADRRLRGVALAAFGLEGDIDATYFVRRVLADGTTDPSALANRLADRRYREMSRAFGFGDGAVPNTLLPGFADRIAERFVALSFEAAVGERDETLRLALDARRSLPGLAREGASDDTAWFTVMGTAPLRRVLEGALGLPAGFGALDLDRQLGEFRARASQRFGVDTIAEIAAEPTLSRVIDVFLLRAEASAATATSPALVLLRGF